MDLKNREEAAELKRNIHFVFDSPQGKEVMKYLEQIGGWTPNIFDSKETNDIIGRDANRRLIGTIKTILSLSPDQIVLLAGGDENSV